jgi:hypothetical protein
MSIRSFVVAASLCSVAAVSQAVPLVVTFVPHEGSSEVKVQGPPHQTGHYTFAFEDEDKKAPPAQAYGFGLANFPSHAGGQRPEMPELPVVLPTPGQGLGNDPAFNPPGLSMDNPGQGLGPSSVHTSQVPEPGSLALLMLSLTGLLALRLGRRSR